MAIFEKKNFNGQVFGRYVDRVPNPIKNQLIKSGAIRMRPDLAASMKEGPGGNYLLHRSTMKNFRNNDEIYHNMTFPLERRAQIDERSVDREAALGIVKNILSGTSNLFDCNLIPLWSLVNYL